MLRLHLAECRDCGVASVQRRLFHEVRQCREDLRIHTKAKTLRGDRGEGGGGLGDDLGREGDIAEIAAKALSFVQAPSKQFLYGFRFLRIGVFPVEEHPTEGDDGIGLRALRVGQKNPQVVGQFSRRNGRRCAFERRGDVVAGLVLQKLPPLSPTFGQNRAPRNRSIPRSA